MMFILETILEMNVNLDSGSNNLGACIGVRYGKSPPLAKGKTVNTKEFAP